MAEETKIGMPEIPSSWTAVTDCEGALWVRRPNRKHVCWSPAIDESGKPTPNVTIDGDELIYEYGPIDKAVDPRG